MTVAKKMTAVSCLKISIHAPGRGRMRVHAGWKLRRRYGAASPRASAVKTAKVMAAGCARAKPMAAPMSGAVQGVATTVARTPVKKLPV